MKLTKRIILIFLAISYFLFTNSCAQDDGAIEVEKKVGFFEYEFSYQLEVDSVLVNKKAYKRININDAFFIVDNDTELPDPLPAMGFRQLDLYLFSNTYSESHLMSKGDSYIKIVLVDTLAFEKGSPDLIEFNYMLRSMNGVLTDLRPACMEVKAYINLLSGENFEDYVFEKEVIGQLSRYLPLFKLGPKHYQMSSNGLYQSFKYNLFYVGDITQLLQFPLLKN